MYMFAINQDFSTPIFNIMIPFSMSLSSSHTETLHYSQQLVVKYCNFNTHVYVCNR